MPLPNNALVLVADGRKMLFFRNHGDENQIDLRTEAHDEREDRKDSEIKTDAPGGIHQSAGYGRSTYEETDFHQQEEDRWIKDAADELQEAGAAQRFRRARHRRSAQGARRAQEVPPQGSREAARLHRQQGDERAARARHRGPARAAARRNCRRSEQLAATARSRRRRSTPSAIRPEPSPSSSMCFAAAGVRLVVDVRTVPALAHQPAVSISTCFRRELAAFQIGYERIAELGGLRGRVARRAARSEWLLGKPELPQLRRLRAVGRLRGRPRPAACASRASSPTAIMCAEAVWWRCHRRIIADYLWPAAARSST